MNNVENGPLEFRYKCLDKNTQSLGAKNGTGSLTGSKITIGEQTIPFKDLLSFEYQDGKIHFGFLNELDEYMALNLEIYRVPIAKFVDSVNAIRSSWLADSERNRLIQHGDLSQYRDERCPFCESTILLTGLPKTDQVFCEYCDTLFTLKRDEVLEEECHFRICENCNMYSRPREFAIFYFYFLIVTFGFHHNTVKRCSGCMRKSAWKMVFGNLLGMLGFPFALIQLYRSYSTSKLSGRFQRLDDANVLASRGKIDAALDTYDSIMEAVPLCAGVKFNIGNGLLIKQDFEHAQKMFELALDDCSNYWPAVSGLVESLKQQGKTAQLKAVEELWGLAIYGDRR